MHYKKIIQYCLMAISISAFHSAASAAGDELSEHADTYNRFFFSAPRPANYLDVKTSVTPNHLREFRTVLPGILYRGGGPGGQIPLPMASLTSLCEAGFSLAVYGYTLNFHDVGPVNCTSKLTGKPHTLHYIAGEILDVGFKKNYLAKVRAVIDQPELGPVFVHCWNGFHASGELAAIALRQFCGWDGDRASAYWLRHSGGFPLITRIRKFTPISELNVTRAQQEALCRQAQ